MQDKITWKMIYDEFKDTYPSKHKETIHYEPFGVAEILIFMKDGSKYVYNHQYHRLRCVQEPRPIPEPEPLSDEERLNEFSKKLRKVMKSRHINQRELSELTGISRQAINRYLNGERIPDIRIIFRIMDALECEPNDLLLTKRYK